MGRVRVNRQIHKQIDRIWQWNAMERGELIATAVVEKIWDVMELLGTQPNLGALGRRRGTPTRRFLAGDYWVYYQAVPGGARVVCLRHYKQDQSKDWDGTNE